MAAGLRIERVVGGDVEWYLRPLARLRIEVFREFPYLYDGNEAYERAYLQTYVDSPGSLLVAVFDGAEMVGASTCCPLADEDPAFRTPFERAGFDLDEVFYLGESVLLPRYRGRGIYRTLFAERERRAAQRNARFTTFCAVQRPADHPRKPTDYRPLDPFWTRIGYRKRTDLTAEFPWQDLDEAEATPKPMVFWLKPVEPLAAPDAGRMGTCTTAPT